MNWDLDSFFREYIQECYDGKHNIIVTIIGIFLLFSNYAHLMAIVVSIDPGYLNSIFSCFVVKFFHAMTKYETFDVGYFVGCEYFAFAFIVLYYFLLLPKRKWSIYHLQFQSNLLNYRECAASNDEIIAYYYE